MFVENNPFSIDLALYGEKVKHETNKHGTFPHLYCALDTKTVVWAKPIALVDGKHVVPAE